MSMVRFSGFSNPSASGDRLYDIAEKGFALTGKIKGKTDAFVARQASDTALGKVKSGAAKVGGGFLSELLDAFDYREMIELPWFRGKTFKIVAPPKGALIFCLLPCVIGARLYYAFQRGKKHNDFREIGDTLRRDIPAISAFLFLLAPLTAKINERKRGTDGLDLIDPNTGKVLTYSQLKNYRLDTPEVLQAIMKEGNGQGFSKAMKGLEAYGEHPKLARLVKEVLPDIESLANLKTDNQPELATLSQRVHEGLAAIEAKRAQIVKGYAKEGVKIPLNLADDVRDLVVKYGKTRRLPVDVGSFLACLFVIGWLPIWFNDMWSRKQFAEEMSHQASGTAPANPAVPAAPASFDPAATFAALQQSSRLGAGFQRGGF